MEGRNTMDDNNKKMYLLNVLNGKWRVLIIEDLFTGKKQFSEIHQDIKGISKKVLADNLQYLVRSGIIDKHSYPVFPPKAVYKLSDRGMNIKPILDDIYRWGIENYTPFAEETTDGFYNIFQ